MGTDTRSGILVTMIEGTGAEYSGYSVLDVAPVRAIALIGFREQKNYEWKGQRK